MTSGSTPGLVIAPTESSAIVSVPIYGQCEVYYRWLRIDKQELTFLARMAGQMHYFRGVNCDGQPDERPNLILQVGLLLRLSSSFEK